MGSKPFINPKFPQIMVSQTEQIQSHNFVMENSIYSISFEIFYHTYLRLKNAFSVRPVQAVAMAMTKVVIPKVEWIGTRAARKDAVADSQHNKSKKLKKPTINWKKREIERFSHTLASVRLWVFSLAILAKNQQIQKSATI